MYLAHNDQRERERKIKKVDDEIFRKDSLRFYENLYDKMKENGKKRESGEPTDQRNGRNCWLGGGSAEEEEEEVRKEVGRERRSEWSGRTRSLFSLLPLLLQGSPVGYRTPLLLPFAASFFFKSSPFLQEDTPLSFPSLPLCTLSLCSRSLPRLVSVCSLALYPPFVNF